MRDHRVLPEMHTHSNTKCATIFLYTAYTTDGKQGEVVTHTYYEEPRPARHVPTKEQIANRLPKNGNQSKQQYIPPQHEASRHRVGHQAGLHPEDTPYLTGNMQQGVVVADDYGLEEDESYYDTRPHTSSRRYTVSPEEIYQSGNTRYHVRYVDVPPRKSRQAQLPPERERHTDAYEAVPQRGGQRRQFHPLVWLGFFGVFLVLGWFGLNAFTSWYQGVQDDWTYGKQRHFEVNAVVGHNDSVQHPSHFTAENNNGQIIVIELPGGNVSKARIYQIETVPGNAGNPPVKLMFQDVNGDGKLDMIVQIGDGGAMIYLTLFNNGQEFVSKL
jgi:hypothetical protein